MDHPLLHISTATAWAEAQTRGDYRADSLLTEGFIHCSTPAQVADTANRLFPGHTDLILLVIDADRLTPPLKYEPAPNGQYFPHLYGPLNLDAVVEVREFRPTPSGHFERPACLPTVPWRDLRVGDRVRIRRLPSKAQNPALHFPEETRAVYLQLIAANAVLTIDEIDDFGHPWTEHFDFDKNDQLIITGTGHTLALFDDSWEHAEPLP